MADSAAGLESGESSMAESAGELNSLEDALAAGPSPLRDVLPPATPAQAAAFSAALRGTSLLLRAARGWAVGGPARATRAAA